MDGEIKGAVDGRLYFAAAAAPDGGGQRFEHIYEVAHIGHPGRSVIDGLSFRDS